MPCNEKEINKRPQFQSEREMHQFVKDCIGVIKGQRFLLPSEIIEVANHNIFPMIFGKKTKVTIERLLGLKDFSENISDYIGQNFDPTLRGSEKFAWLHKLIIDPKTNQVVLPIIFPEVEREPQRSAEISADISVENESSLQAASDYFSKTFKEIADQKTNAAFPYNQNTNPSENIDSVSPLAKVELISEIQEIFPDFILATSSKDLLPNSLSFYFASKQGVEALKDKSAFFSVGDWRTAFLDGEVSEDANRAHFVVLNKEAFTRHDLLRALMNYVFPYNLSDDEVFLNEIRDLAKQINHDSALSVLSDPSKINPKIFQPENAKLLVVDIVLFELAKSCSINAQKMGILPNQFAENAKYLQKYQLVKAQDVESFASHATTLGKRIFTRSATQAIAVELPLMIWNDLYHKQLRNYLPQSMKIPAVDSGIAGLMRGCATFASIALTVGGAEASSAILIGAMAGGAAYLAGETCMNFVNDCAQKSGFDKGFFYDLLKGMNREYQKLPRPVKSFSKQFVQSFVISVLSDKILKGQVFAPGSTTALSAYNALESVLTGALTATMTGVVGATFTKVSNWCYSQFTKKDDAKVPESDAENPANSPSKAAVKILKRSSSRTTAINHV